MNCTASSGRYRIYYPQRAYQQSMDPGTGKCTVLRLEAVLKELYQQTGSVGVSQICTDISDCYQPCHHLIGSILYLLIMITTIIMWANGHHSHTDIFLYACVESPYNQLDSACFAFGPISNF